MILRLVAAPTAEPLIVSEAKDHLRIEHELDDAYLQALIRVAREYAEKVTWRAFISQSWELVLEGFPDEDFIELPKGTLQSVTSIQYIDANGVTQTLGTSVYEVDTKSRRGRVMLKYEQDWPDTRDRWNAVLVQYVTGYGNGEDVPSPVKQAMLLLVAQMYEQRVPEITGTIIARVGFAVDALLASYRLRRF